MIVIALLLYNSNFTLEEYTYDNNPNPQFNSGFLGTIAVNHQKNNLIKTSHYNTSGNHMYTIEYLYEYNSANYPINKKRTYLNGDIQTTEFIYH